MHPCAPGREPVGIDQEHDRRDRDLADPTEHEEQRRQHDSPEGELGQPDGVREVEHVPGEPEDERTEQDDGRKRHDRYCQTACDQGADSKRPQ